MRREHLASVAAAKMVSPHRPLPLSERPRQLNSLACRLFGDVRHYRSASTYLSEINPAMLNGTQLGEQIVLKNNDMFTISDRSFKFCTIGGSSNTQKVRRRNARSAQPAPAAGLLFFLPPGREEWLLMFILALG